jgi:hypothetical protein
VRHATRHPIATRDKLGDDDAMSSKLGLTSGAAIVALVIAACSGDDSSSGPAEVDTSICNVNSKCPNEPAESDADKKLCADTLKGKCAASYRTLDTCQKKNEVCASDGKADGNATAEKCRPELDAYLACSFPSATPKDAGGGG